MNRKAFNFRILFSAVILLMNVSLLPDVCCAQSKTFTNFEIGVSFVSHSTTFPWGQKPIVCVDSFPSSSWKDLVDLGITLPGMKVVNVNKTFPRDLIDSGAKYGLHICLLDDSLSEASRWERRYFQVEAKEDFQNNNAGTPTFRNGFQLLDLRYDLHRKYFTTGAASNGIVFRQAKDPPG